MPNRIRSQLDVAISFWSVYKWLKFWFWYQMKNLLEFMKTYRKMEYFWRKKSHISYANESNLMQFFKIRKISFRKNAFILWNKKIRNYAGSRLYPILKCTLKCIVSCYSRPLHSVLNFVHTYNCFNCLKVSISLLQKNKIKTN